MYREAGWVIVVGIDIGLPELLVCARRAPSASRQVTAVQSYGDYLLASSRKSCRIGRFSGLVHYMEKAVKVMRSELILLSGSGFACR
jgi:hypothetical protein